MRCASTWLASAERGICACIAGQSWCQPSAPSRLTTDCMNRSAGGGGMGSSTPLVPLSRMRGGGGGKNNQPLHTNGERSTRQAPECQTRLVQSQFLCYH